MAAVGSEDELAGLRDEMYDRFGSPPESTERLFDLVGLRLIARQCKVSRIEAGPSYMTVSFRNDSEIEVDKLFRLRDHHKGLRYREDGFDMPVATRDPLGVIDSVKNILLSIRRER